MKFDNFMVLEFPSKASNEGFARSAVACFAAQMDPTLEELGDIRTAVSEAAAPGRQSDPAEKLAKNRFLYPICQTDGLRPAHPGPYRRGGHPA